MSKAFRFKPGDLVRVSMHGFRSVRFVVGWSERVKGGQVKVYAANIKGYWYWQHSLEPVKPVYREWAAAGHGIRYLTLERGDKALMGMDEIRRYLNKLEKEVANYRELIKGAPKEHFRQEYGA